MIKKIEHIGIAVKDLQKSEALFEKLLGQKPYKQEEVKSEGVITSFFKIADQKISECAENNLELEDISAELIAIQEQEIEDGNPIVTNVNGFDMAVQPVPKTEVGSLIKRQAIAKDSKGIIVLKGEPSFSASDQILIDELAFYITNNNLKA